MGGTAGVMGFELEPVPLAWIVTGRDDCRAAGLMVQHVIAEDGGWGGLVGEEDLDSLSGANGGHGFGELEGQEPGVIANNQALVGYAGLF